MKKVYICSRYRADERHTISANVRRALYACGCALDRGYAPFAPHLIYPQCLDDDNPNERKIGMNAGLNWLVACDELWQWGISVSEGMRAEIALANKLGIPIKVFDSLGVPKELWRREIKFISYNGKWPDLCGGTLCFSVNGQKRRTIGCALRSTGGLMLQNTGGMIGGVYEGNWVLYRGNPAFADFNSQDFDVLTDEVNNHVEKCCCGGCR